VRPGEKASDGQHSWLHLQVPARGLKEGAPPRPPKKTLFRTPRRPPQRAHRHLRPCTPAGGRFAVDWVAGNAGLCSPEPTDPFWLGDGSLRSDSYVSVFLGRIPMPVQKGMSSSSAKSVGVSDPSCGPLGETRGHPGCSDWSCRIFHLTELGGRCRRPAISVTDTSCCFMSWSWTSSSSSHGAPVLGYSAALDHME